MRWGRRCVPETVLLTGATGFIGMELLARFIERDDAEVICLVRAPSSEGAQARLESVYNLLYEERPQGIERVDAVAGDVSVDGLGLSDRDRDMLLSRVTSIIHCAASISFDLPLETARQTNAVRTAADDRARTRQLADRGTLRRHLHVSTAYVAGRYHGHFREIDLDVGQGFRNTYEETKCAGEKAVHEATGDLPLVVARPSIVVGDSRTGWTSVFNVVYWPLRAYSRGLMDEVPIDPDVALPSDRADRLRRRWSARAPRSGGRARDRASRRRPGSAITNQELIELASRYFDRPPPRLVHHADSTPDQAAVYLPYFGIEATLDDTRASDPRSAWNRAAAPARLLHADHRLRRARPLGQEPTDA